MKALDQDPSEWQRVVTLVDALAVNRCLARSNSLKSTGAGLQQTHNEIFS